MLITVILIVWLATLTLVVCVCRTAAAGEPDGSSHAVALAGEGDGSSQALALASIGERLVLGQARTAPAGRRPLHCGPAPGGRRPTTWRLRSSAHADG